VSDPTEAVQSDEVALSVPFWAVVALGATGTAVGVLLVPLTWAIPAYGLWGAILGVVTAIDLRELRIPNRINLVAAVVTFPLLALATLANIDGSSFMRAVAGAFAGFGVYLALNLISPRSLGMGDVKLAFTIGAHLAFIGWPVWFQGIFFAFLSMSVVGLILMVAKLAGRKTAVPFGPFMVFGAFSALGIATIQAI